MSFNRRSKNITEGVARAPNRSMYYGMGYTEANLDQNYPNPFNPSTAIRYFLPHTADVRLTVYDLMGREVATLVSERQSPGVYETRWDGKTKAGTAVASGVYFYSLQAGEMIQTRKMVLVK